LALLIDPVLDYSTLIGGDADEGACGITVDPAGAVYVTGWTQSANFGDRADVFILKYHPARGTDYLVFLGGSELDQGLAIAADAGGNAYVLGHTGSEDFPGTNAVQTTLRGRSDAFVCKVDPTGDRLLYSTYLGGSDGEISLFLPGIVAGGGGIAVDSAGHAYVVGATASTDFPSTTNAFQRGLADTDPFAPRADVFVTKLSPQGNELRYSTYLGGAGREQGMAIAVDAQGQAYVTGSTAATNFPLARALQAMRVTSGEVAFVTKLNPAGSELVFSTYLTGASQGNGIAVDPDAAVYLAGHGKGGLPTTPRAFQRQPHSSGSQDAFILKLTAAGNAVAYSTYLGGVQTETAWGLALHGKQAVVVGARAPNRNRSSPIAVFRCVAPFKRTTSAWTRRSLSRSSMRPATPSTAACSEDPSTTWRAPWRWMRREACTWRVRVLRPIFPCAILCGIEASAWRASTPNSVMTRVEP
jgi:hypothetical protein